MYASSTHTWGTGTRGKQTRYGARGCRAVAPGTYLVVIRVKVTQVDGGKVARGERLEPPRLLRRRRGAGRGSAKLLSANQQRHAPQTHSRGSRRPLASPKRRWPSASGRCPPGETNGKHGFRRLINSTQGGPDLVEPVEQVAVGEWGGACVAVGRVEPVGEGPRVGRAASLREELRDVRTVVPPRVEGAVVRVGRVQRRVD